MAKQLLGTQTTDENGVATFTLTGTGRGKLNLIAESGGLVSEPYPVIDAIFKDRGTSTDYGTWDNTTYTAEGETVRGDDYTTLTPASSWERIDKTISDNNDFAMEFDINITFTSSYIAFRYYNSNTLSNARWTLIDFSMVSGNWHHIKIERKGNDFTPIVDGNRLDWAKKTLDGSINKFSLIGDNTQMSNIKYKNFAYYPI